MKKEKKTELTETLQRLQAEFENYKKYVEKRNGDLVKCASAELIKKLLPMLDSFELALKNTKNHEEFVKGVELIYSQLFQTLEEHGLRPIGSLNKKFDPEFHEVLLQEKSGKEEGTILEELQKGYILNNLVIRHSKVKIAKKEGAEKSEILRSKASGTTNVVSGISQKGDDVNEKGNSND